jgi:hypothetical protein
MTRESKSRMSTSPISAEDDVDVVDSGEEDVEMASPGDTTEETLLELTREAEANIDSEVEELLASPSRSASGLKLRQWRRGHVKLWDLNTTNAQLDKIFPDINQGTDTDTPLLNRWKVHQLQQTKAKKKRHPTPSSSPGRNYAASDMGLFGGLPGELRNYIYRLAFVAADGEPMLIEGSDLVCGTGACVHRRATIAAPGLASTCRQIWQEMMPIYCAENATFKFNAAMTRNRCVEKWVKSMNTYARFIRKVVMEVQVLNRTRQGVTSTLQEVIVETPAGREDGRFEVSLSAMIPPEKVKLSGLKEFVEKLNDGEERGRASKLAYIAGSDELANLVFWCKK